MDRLRIREDLIRATDRGTARHMYIHHVAAVAQRDSERVSYWEQIVNDTSTWTQTVFGHDMMRAIQQLPAIRTTRLFISPTNPDRQWVSSLDAEDWESL